MDASECASNITSPSLCALSWCSLVRCFFFIHTRALSLSHNGNHSLHILRKLYPIHILHSVCVKYSMSHTSTAITNPCFSLLVGSILFPVQQTTTVLLFFVEQSQHEESHNTPTWRVLIPLF